MPGRWTEAWHLLRSMQAECPPFQAVPQDRLLAELCTALLRAGQWRLGRQFLTGSAAVPVPQALAEQVVLAAAAEYFQAAGAPEGLEIDKVPQPGASVARLTLPGDRRHAASLWVLPWGGVAANICASLTVLAGCSVQAEECLSVLPNSRAVNVQYRAIQGYRLLPSFGITMLPADFSQVGLRTQVECQHCKALSCQANGAVARQGGQPSQEQLAICKLAVRRSMQEVRICCLQVTNRTTLIEAALQHQPTLGSEPARLLHLSQLLGIDSDSKVWPRLHNSWSCCKLGMSQLWTAMAAPGKKGCRLQSLKAVGVCRSFSSYSCRPLLPSTPGRRLLTCSSHCACKATKLQLL